MSEHPTSDPTEQASSSAETKPTEYDPTLVEMVKALQAANAYLVRSGKVVVHIDHNGKVMQVTTEAVAFRRKKN